MRIKTRDTLLLVQRAGQAGGTPVWEVQAAVTSPSCMLAGYERGPVRADGELRQRIAEFTARRLHRIELLLPKEGWLGFAHAESDSLVVRYCLGGLGTGAWLEGEVCLEGETAKACCRDLSKLA